MRKLIMSLMFVSGSFAFADGFVCENLDANIRVKVYNQTSPGSGTRNAAVMILSNPSVSSGRKTIATFNAENALVTNESSTYTALVDLRFKDSNRKGELLGGTKLGEVKYVILDVDFNYSAPVDNGEVLKGEVILTRRNGNDDIRIDVACARYLKN